MLRRRYRQIVFFFARTLLSLTFWELVLPRLGMRKRSAENRSRRLQRAAAQYRALATQLGGVLIKVGQFLSSRVDVLPPEITNELSGLQDEVAPEDFSDIRRVAESEFGMPLEKKYFWFDETPLAAASLGQAHLARLRLESPDSLMVDGVLIDNTGEFADLVVKVQRPNIETIIATDLAALRTVGKWLHRYPPIRKRANVPALIREFTRTLYEEIDYLAEGRNAETFAENFKDQDGILVPKVYWSHTTKRVLSLEDVRGIKITDYDAISAAGIDRAEVASRLLDTYLKQIFQDSFFHADPHPGNLFVKLLHSQEAADGNQPAWQLTFVDFGMVGRIPPQTRAGVRELLIGVALRDPARITKAYKILDILLPGANLELIEKAEEAVFSRFWGKSMSEMTSFSADEMREYSHEFRALVYDMPFQVPQDIIFLVRAVGILSGMCTGLDPDFNIWTHLSPFSKQLIAEEVGTNPQEWINELGVIARKVIAFPGRMESILTMLERGEMITRDPTLSVDVKRLELSVRRLSSTVYVVSFLVLAVLLYLNSEWALAGVFAFGALIAWLWSIWHHQP
jgi:predicted unusual protein kinase regulating ubiquinone biosynthesis (AarF/ABC1/UbiB family)